VLRRSVYFSGSIFLSFTLGAFMAANAQRPQQRPRLVLDALDLDHDGSLSALEIQSASTSLYTLDKEGDGQISIEELTPRRQDAGANSEQLVRQLMQFDKNGDGVLTPEELPERIQPLFIRGDVNMDGKLTSEEIRQSAARTSGPRGRGEDPAEQISIMHLDPIFDILDADRNGALSAEEIQAANTHLLQLDKNRDGAVSADEMLMRQQSPAQRTAHVLGEFDTNHDGRLSHEEVPDGLRNRFAEADKNGDGFLDRTELEQMFTGMPAGGFRGGAGVRPENNGTHDEQPKGTNN